MYHQHSWLNSLAFSWKYEEPAKKPKVPKCGNLEFCPKPSLYKQSSNSKLNSHFALFSHIYVFNTKSDDAVEIIVAMKW